MMALQMLLEVLTMVGIGAVGNKCYLQPKSPGAFIAVMLCGAALAFVPSFFTWLWAKARR